MKKASPQEKVFVMTLSWLIPGYGFYRHGLRWRALLFFVLLEASFVIGAVLRGSVLLPDLNPHSEGFNIVTILTFVTQMFNGALAFVSLLPELSGAKAAILPYDEAYKFADLGAFYLLVSGGMNYFVLTNTWDHFYGRKAQSEADRHAGAASAGEE